MKIYVQINKRKRMLFEKLLMKILPLSYHVDIMSNHFGLVSKYEIPFETENQKKTIVTIAKTLS